MFHLINLYVIAPSRNSEQKLTLFADYRFQGGFIVATFLYWPDNWLFTDYACITRH